MTRILEQDADVLAQFLTTSRCPFDYFEDDKLEELLEGNNQRGHRTLANLHMSLLHASGSPDDHYGGQDLGLSETIDQTGPLSEPLA